MNDLISRQAALDAIDKVAEMFPYRIPGQSKTYRQYNEAWSDACDASARAVEGLPSAQPQSTMGQANDTTQSTNDCISRAAAVDSMCELMHHWFGSDPKDEIREIKRELGKLPSAQPIDVREAYYRGKIDGVKECTARLNKVTEEFANGQQFDKA